MITGLFKEHSVRQSHGEKKKKKKEKKKKKKKKKKKNWVEHRSSITRNDLASYYQGTPGVKPADIVPLFLVVCDCGVGWTSGRTIAVIVLTPHQITSQGGKRGSSFETVL